jgi:WD40 repeat protein/serine/threonine protein kinase
MDTEQNLLFGVLAVRADLITAGQLADAWEAWHVRKEPLREILRRWGWITPTDEGRIDSLCQRYLGSHQGNVAASLHAAVEQKIIVNLGGTRDPKAQRLLADLLHRPASPADPATAATVRYAAETRDRYTLVKLQATGGIGVIWLAYDSDLGRTVALKELRPETVSDLRACHRFLSEARVTGQLEHPGIVPVYELGKRTEDQKPFYTMRFVKGRTLTEAVRAYHRERAARRAGTLERNELLGNFVALCKTLAYAHSRGVIHRDIKGQNVLLGDFGEVIVLDWGLAKIVQRIKGVDALPVVLTEDGAVQTMPGQALGTPAFMAPEQAAGRLDLIDHRADIYSLGAILYEILTGRPPFVGRNVEEVLRRVRFEPPVPPGQLCPEVPASLQAVCLRALAKDLTRRYDSAADLAHEVQRCLADEPVQAYPESWRQRVGRWTRRHQTWVRAAAVAGVLLALVSGVAVIGLSAAHHQTNAVLASLEAALDEKQQAVHSLEEEQAKAQKAAAELRRTSYFQGIALSDREWERANLTRAQELLGGCPEELRGWEWYYLQRVYELALKSIKLDLGESQVKAVAWSPDGKLLATAAHYGKGGRSGPDEIDQASAVKVWDVVGRREAFVLQGHARAVEAIAWSPDGRFLATASADKTVKLWEVRRAEGGGRKEELRTVHSAFRTLAGHASLIHALAWSPDGRRLATASADKTVKVWDVQQGNVVLTFEGHKSGVETVAWSPDGKRLASASADKTVKVWDADTGKEIATSHNADQAVHAVAWDADSRRLALATEERVAVVPVAGSGKSFRLEGHSGPVLAMAWSPDGNYLATGGADKTVLIWDAATGGKVRALKGHGDRVTAVAWTRDSRWLASAGDDRTAQVWDLGAAADPRILRSPAGAVLVNAVEAIAWSPDGKRLAAGTDDGVVRLWDATAGRRVRTLQGGAGVIQGLAWDAEGKRLAVACADGTSQIWNPEMEALIRSLKGDHEPVRAVAWSPDGKRLASARKQSVVVWDLATGGRQTHRLDGRWTVAWSPDGQWLASPGLGPEGSQTVIVWDPAAGEKVCTLRGHTDWVTALCWSPDGKRLASASADKTVRVWDVAEARTVLTLKGHTDGVRAVSWSPDGQRLASAGEDKTVKVWEALDGDAVLTLKEDAQSVYTVAWSADGSCLAAAGLDGTIRIWEALGYKAR